MHKITGKQCKAARGLLKWNVYDLANQVKNIQAKRIDSFEHGSVHIMDWENSELVRGFKKAGVLFKSDFEVVLDTDKKDTDPRYIAGQGNGASIVLDVDQTILSDSSTQKMLPSDAAELFEEEKDKST